MKTLIRTIVAIAVVMTIGINASAAQTLNITGRVVDENDRPFPGVNIVMKGTQHATITDIKGNFTIQTQKRQVLVFMYLGYETQEVVVKDETPLNIKMIPAAVVLEEAVVVAFGRKSAGSANKESRAQAAMHTHVSYFDYSESEEFNHIKENRFVAVSKSPLSTFSLDVDGASYSNVRRMLNAGNYPDADAVRVEEFVNYFSYDYPAPVADAPVRITTEVGKCPWNSNHKLVSIGVKARQIPAENIPASNFVFLIDVSGSMYSRLDMVKSSMKLLVDNLRPEDRVAIVVYASQVGVKLESTPGSDKQKIKEALDNLTAGGSTAGAAGIRLAYQTARANLIESGNNRVILCTDGDFNVGVSSTQELEKLIENERKSGVFLTVLGYGMGNYKDNRMQTLAEKGNGNYAYIDTMQEANRVLVNEFGSTMYTVAKDVKIQVEFNPANVQSYRLVGYESRLLNDEDFNDDAIDAGELGAGHTVTALYEIVPVGVKGAPGSIDPLKYQPERNNAKNKADDGELMTVKLRYKEPDGNKSKLMESVVTDSNRNSNSVDFCFASAAAMFGQLLRDSDFKGDATYDTVVEYARKGLGEDPNGYRHEMIRLAETASRMQEK